MIYLRQLGLGMLRLSEEQLQEIETRMKAKGGVSARIHVSELRESTGTEAGVILKAQLLKTPSRKPHKGPGATFEHQLLARQLIQAQIPYREEFRFEPKRRWRFDFMVDAFPTSIGIEIVGGLWMKRGGHSQGQAQLDDMEKFNHAAKLGFRVLQFSPQQVKDGEAIGFIEQVLA